MGPPRSGTCWPGSAASWSGIGWLGLVNVSLAFAAMFAGIAGLAAGTAAVLVNAQAATAATTLVWFAKAQHCPLSALTPGCSWSR